MGLRPAKLVGPTRGKARRGNRESEGLINQKPRDEYPEMSSTYGSQAFYGQRMLAPSSYLDKARAISSSEGAHPLTGDFPEPRS